MCAKVTRGFVQDNDNKTNGKTDAVATGVLHSTVAVNNDILLTRFDEDQGPCPVWLTAPGDAVPKPLSFHSDHVVRSLINNPIQCNPIGLLFYDQIGAWVDQCCFLLALKAAVGSRLVATVVTRSTAFGSGFRP